jgi:hypothetical protein
MGARHGWRPGAKANDDYQLRTDNPLGRDPAMGDGFDSAASRSPVRGMTNQNRCALRDALKQIHARSGAQ